MKKMCQGCKSLWIIVSIMIIITACNNNEATSTPIATPENPATTGETLPASATPANLTDENGYPGVSVSAYPAPDTTTATTSGAYPGPEATEPLGGPLGPNFEIQRPVKAGDTTISGRAPKNLFIGIADITYGGGLLGSGQSDGNGNFSFTVTALPEKHRIGITILDATMSMEEAATEYFAYRGEGASNIPNVGFFFDTVLVEP